MRVPGKDRDDTAIQISRSQFPSPGHPGLGAAVLLASDANYPDALAGTPLAVAKDGPLLLTTPSRLSPAVADEIKRVAPKGSTVYLLGGPSALDPSIDAQVQALGYTPQRVAGSNRFATAVDIAGLLGDPSQILEASGVDFADALAAGAAARLHLRLGGRTVTSGGAVLLTNGRSQASETAAYLAGHKADTVVAVGGPAAVADTRATPVVGTDRYTTAVMVAQHFFTVPNPAYPENPQQFFLPKNLAFASGITFADALAGSADTNGSPMLLVKPCGPLPSSLSAYLSSVHAAAVGSPGGGVGGLLFGGARAVGDDVLAEIERAV
jgi:ell wall binding domain 2 (CWB2)